MSELRLDGVSKSFGRVSAIDDASFVVPDRSITAIVGPSGGGKTTLLRLIAGFERPDRGSIAFDDVVVSGGSHFLKPELRSVGIVPQEGALFPHLDVAGNIGFGLPRGPERRARIEECLALVGLEGFGSRRPHELSGGQQQRVSLARALAPRPRVILLDEPFSALDAVTRPDVAADVVAALRNDGATAVIVTHDRDEALAVADQLVIVIGGRIHQCGPPAQLYRTPASSEVALFLGDARILSGRVEGDHVRTSEGDFPLNAAGRTCTGEVEVIIRPGQAAVFPLS